MSALSRTQGPSTIASDELVPGTIHIALPRICSFSRGRWSCSRLRTPRLPSTRRTLAQACARRWPRLHLSTSEGGRSLDKASRTHSYFARTTRATRVGCLDCQCDACGVRVGVSSMLTVSGSGSGGGFRRRGSKSWLCLRAGAAVYSQQEDDRRMVGITEARRRARMLLYVNGLTCGGCARS